MPMRTTPRTRVTKGGSQCAAWVICLSLQMPHPSDNSIDGISAFRPDSVNHFPRGSKDHSWAFELQVVRVLGHASEKTKQTNATVTAARGRHRNSTPRYSARTDIESQAPGPSSAIQGEPPRADMRCDSSASYFDPKAFRPWITEVDSV